jgi:signal transduction histidine kinase
MSCSLPRPDGPPDTPDLRRANERLQAYNEVLRAQTDMLLEQREELRTAYDELARAAAAKDELLGLVSHELRTPLAIVKNGLAILKKGHAGPVTPQQAHFIAMGLDALRGLDRILDDILDWQKLLAGNALCEPVPGDLRAALAEAVARFGPLLASRGLAFVHEAPEPLPARFDHGRLVQVLQNLLSNAAKFTPAGGRIELSASRDADGPRIEVRDDGPGIPPAERGRIFEPFVQLDGGLTRETAGTGLGLAICKKIVETGHGGRLWVQDSPGGGATFAIALPATPPEEMTP